MVAEVPRMIPIENRSVVSSPKERLDATRIDFGKCFTPNFFCVEFCCGRWQDARIEPLRCFEMHPAALVFHYGQAIFEGLKAFQQRNGRLVLFRPDMNARRFNRSAERLDMPRVDEEFFVRVMLELVKNERHYVPASPGSLYLRPTMIATEACIGVKSASEFLFYVMALPTAGYFKEVRDGAGSIDVLVCESATRACPGGTGHVKAAGNYAGTLKVTSVAKRMGCAQVLFLDAVEREKVEEMGGMNVFFVHKDTLVTPALTDTILPGITRECVLALARDLSIQVTETPISIRQVLEGIENGEVTEAIACGTAASITGIGTLRFEDGKIAKIGQGAPGPVTNLLHRRLRSIQYGECEDNHGWAVEVCMADQGVVRTP
jgi:branched-chain amino acid aminotransferase